MCLEVGGVTKPRGGSVSFDCCATPPLAVGLQLPLVALMEHANEFVDIMDTDSPLVLCLMMCLKNIMKWLSFSYSRSGGVVMGMASLRYHGDTYRPFILTLTLTDWFNLNTICSKGELQLQN